jgi:hypothetical protein
MRVRVGVGGNIRENIYTLIYESGDGGNIRENIYVFSNITPHPHIYVFSNTTYMLSLILPPTPTLIYEVLSTLHI